MLYFSNCQAVNLETGVNVQYIQTLINIVALLKTNEKKVSFCEFIVFRNHASNIALIDFQSRMN